MKKLFYILLLFLSSFGFAQKTNVDSLVRIWKNIKVADTIRLNTIQKIVQFYDTSQPDSSIYFAQMAIDFAVKKNIQEYQVEEMRFLGRAYYDKHDNKKALAVFFKAEKLAEKIKYKRELALICKEIGLIYSNQGNYDKALAFYQKSLSIFESTKDTLIVASTITNMGNVFYAQGSYDKALDSYLKALKYNEAAIDKAGIAVSYMNIGNIYLNKGNTKKGLENYLNSLKLNLEIGDKSEIAGSYINIGNVYSNTGEYDKAIDYYLKATKIQEVIDDKIGMIYSYNNIGDIYIKQKQYDKALEVLFKCEDISKTMDYKEGISLADANIGDAYFRLNKINKALPYIHNSLAIAKEIGFKELIKACYSLLSEIYVKEGNYKKAFEYNALYSNIKDSLLNEESYKQITEMNAKYESEKKEKDISLLKKDKELLNKDIALQESQIEKQKFFNFLFIGILLFALTVALILYNRYSVKQKLSLSLLEKNDELIEKNNLIESQKEKIIDNINYAKLIQESFLIEEADVKAVFPDSFILYKPKDIVSGDFYWCSKVEDKVIVAAIDCTGHGVSGAFMSLIGNTLLDQIINQQNIIVPSEILRLLNLEFYKALNKKQDGVVSGDGMDIALCCVDYRNKTLAYAGANNPLYIYSGNQLQIIKGDNQTIGAEVISKRIDKTKIEFTNHEFSITDNMSIYLFSDGYIDQYGGIERKKFGSQRFRELIISCQQYSMDEQKEKFLSAHEKWKVNTTQIDDILVIGLKL